MKVEDPQAEFVVGEHFAGGKMTQKASHHEEMSAVVSTFCIARSPRLSTNRPCHRTVKARIPKPAHQRTRSSVSLLQWTVLMRWTVAASSNAGCSTSIARLADPRLELFLHVDHGPPDVRYCRARHAQLFELDPKRLCVPMRCVNDGTQSRFDIEFKELRVPRTANQAEDIRWTMVHIRNSSRRGSARRRAMDVEQPALELTATVHLISTVH